MIKFQDITLYQGAEALIEHANAFIQPRQKVGIIGINGSGKTSLFQALLGQLELHGGSIDITHGITIAHIEQNIPSITESALLYVMRAKPHCHKLYVDLIQAENNNDMATVASIHAGLADCDGYAFKAQAEKTLHGLGFVQSQLTQKIEDFSGGWRMRLHLARCLLINAELLLLDEPTNHLDLNGILWLQDWLQHYSGTLLLISHDRDFLDQVSTHILHLHQHQLQCYTGNYTSFAEQRAQALALQTAQFRKQQQQMHHMMSYVNRFRYKASKAKQAQSRLKAIERLEKIPPVLADFDFNFNFQQPESLSNPLVNLDNVSIGYDQRTVLTGIHLRIDNQSRIGLLGANGAGKSTFLKALTGKLSPLCGDITRHNKLTIGYFSQHQVESFNPEHSCLKVMQLTAPQISESQLRNYLGAFGFSGEKALRPAEKLSGGEKARLALAKIFWLKPHILLLDEPTNHLDLTMRDALNLALQQYHGAIIVVSHDRFLIRSIADELWLVDNGTVLPYPDDLDSYAKLLMQASTPSKDIKKKQKTDPKTQKRLTELEKQIAKLSKQVDTIDHELAELCAGKQEQHQQRLLQLNMDRQRLISQLDEYETQWLELSEL